MNRVIIDGHSLEIDDVVILTDEDRLCVRLTPELNHFFTPHEVFRGMINLGGIEKLRECTLATADVQALPPTTNVETWLNKARPFTSIRKQNERYVVLQDDEPCFTFEANKIGFGVHLSIGDQKSFRLDPSSRTISISGPNDLIAQIRDRKPVAA
ncbi:MAG: hypothetical protein WC289_02680 [Patescibacteria group bacterium]|jgi:hypothetical protein